RAGPPCLVRRDAHPDAGDRRPRAQAGRRDAHQPLPLPGAARPPQVHQLADGEERDVPHARGVRPAAPAELKRLQKIGLDSFLRLSNNLLTSSRGGSPAPHYVRSSALWTEELSVLGRFPW